MTSLPASARQDVTDNTPSVRDVAMTPLSDLNLSKDPIPAVLVQARSAPYSSSGITACGDIRREVADLDAVLGDDFDTSPPDRRGWTPTGIAQTVVGMVIPFRGIIRELSGANAHEYEFREAIAAGLMRRAYLKGKGQEMGCPYPASPASAELVARLDASSQNSANEAAAVPASADDGTQFVSRPVIQGSE
ncbi:hypothetical protein [Alteraurantiacibacter aestuarii]|uniref:hypothetical protein n=1 Tax=Alteraurantiacibacter aestuarii TaxID=650004 RepID=UPI0031D3E293